MLNHFSRVFFALIIIISILQYSDNDQLFNPFMVIKFITLSFIIFFNTLSQMFH